MTIRIPINAPAEPVGALYYRTPVTPEEAFQAIGRLRKEARDEIDRLIRFLDDTDDHMEREPDGDELDASYPEGTAYGHGSRVLGSPNEDDEECAGDTEPSLGSRNMYESTDQTYWAFHGAGGVDAEDEHDGAEPDHDQEADSADDEPSLGWTVDGRMTGSTMLMGRHGVVCDLEAGEPARQPQGGSTYAGTEIDTEGWYVGRKRLYGLTPDQRQRFKQAMRDGPTPAGVGVY